MPDFQFYETNAGDLTILGPKTLLVDDFIKVMDLIYHKQRRNVTRERRHAGTVYLLSLNKIITQLQLF